MLDLAASGILKALVSNNVHTLSDQRPSPTKCYHISTFSSSPTVLFNTFSSNFPWRTGGHLPGFSKRIDHRNPHIGTKQIEPLPGVEGKTKEKNDSHTMHHQMSERELSPHIHHLIPPTNDRSIYRNETCPWLGRYHFGWPYLFLDIPSAKPINRHCVFFFLFFSITSMMVDVHRTTFLSPMIWEATVCK